MGGLSNHVFAYGSLVGDLEGTPGRLRGFRRHLGVAADNSVEIPGYKRYVNPADGTAPEVFVAFADLTPDDDTVVNGLVVPVTPEQLWELDERERNYDRVDVSLDADPAPGTVWAYMGSPDGRARLEAGVAEDRAVVTRAYLEGLYAAFRALGREEFDEFVESSDIRNLPILELDRVDIP
jgi:gamma-glutamyl AIG2-like cyclotransferase